MVSREQHDVEDRGGVNDGGVPVPKVIDFGIAKATQQGLTEKTIFTQLQQFIGTPAYMSPEQAERSGSDIDTRSDIYSLGVLLYELLTGSTPFDTKELLKSGLDEMRRIIREREPIRPSTRLTQQLRLAGQFQSEIQNPKSKLEADLDWIVMKCLEKDRRRRYDTADSLALDIKRNLNHEPVDARPPSTPYRLGKFVRRNRLMVGALGGMAGMLLLGVLVSTWQALRATRAEREQSRDRQAAVAARGVAEQESARARETAEQLRWTAYAAEMRAAQIALDERNVGRCRELLMKYLPQPGQTDVRGFEWRYLWKQARSDSAKEFRYDNLVCQALLFPDGTTLVTQCIDGSVRIWDTLRKSVVRQLPSVTTLGRQNSKVALSADSALFSVCLSNEVLVFETRSWALRQRLPAAWQAAFSPDSSELVLSDPDKLTFCNLKTGASLSAPRQVHGAPFQQTVFSPDGKLMFLNQRYLGKIEVWDLPHHAPLRILAHDRQCVAMAVSPDLRWLAVGFWDGTLTLWALPEFKQVLTWKADPSLVFAADFSPDSSLLATGGGDINLWRVPNSVSGLSELPLEDTLKGHAGGVWQVAFCLDGTQLVSAGGIDQTARLWPVRKQRRQPRVFSHDGRDEELGLIGAENGFVLLSSRHGMFWSWGPGGMVQGRDFRTGIPTPLSPPPVKATNTWVPEEGIRYLAGDGILYGCATNGAMTAWDLFTGQSKVLLARPPSPCIAGVVTNHGQFFVLVRNLATRQTEAWLEDSSQPSRESWARALAEAYNTCPCVQSPDGKLVASGATDFSVTVTTLDDPPVVRKLLGHKLPLFSVVFSSDSRWLASGSWDSTTRVWDLAGDGRCVHTLRHRGGVIAVQFTPDGRTLVTADRDQTYFWNLQTGQEMMVLSGRPIVWWLTVSAWVVPPESDDGFLIQCPDGTGRFTPVPSLRSIDAEIQQGLSRSP